MMKKTVAISLMLVMFSGMLVIHPAFAHNFVQNSDADLIAKVQEFKIESKLIADNVSNNTLAQWHISKSQEYWGSNEIGILSQKDPNLANQITNSIDDLYSYAGQPSADPSTASQKADAISGLLDQAESEEVSTASQDNATVQALALVNVITEVLKDYGTAIGSTVDLTNMNNMNMSGMDTSSSGNMQGMSGMSGMSSGSMQGMSMPATPIVNMAAYQSAQELTSESQTMFSNLQSIAPPDDSTYLAKAGAAITDLKQKIDAKGSGMDVMMDVHMQVHPNLISAFNIAAVPEFPMPILLVIASFTGIVLMSRMFPRKSN